MAKTGLISLSSRAIIGRYYATLEKTQRASWVDGTSMEFSSNQDSETYKWLGMSPAMREWLGGRQVKSLAVNGITIENKHYESTLDIPVEDVRRDKTGQIMVRVDDLAARNISHWNSLLSALILNGHSSATCYDGQDFFDDDHSSGDSGTQQNDIDATDVPALNLTVAAPTAAEMSAAILGVIAYMNSYLDDQGEPINEGASKFVCMTGLPLFYGSILQACTLSNISAGTGVNNPLVGGGFQVVPVYNARLASATTQMWMFRTDAPCKPFIRQVETDGSLKSIAEGSELEFNNGIWRFGVDSWRNVGYGYWQYACRATLS